MAKDACNRNCRRSVSVNAEWWGWGIHYPVKVTRCVVVERQSPHQELEPQPQERSCRNQLVNHNMSTYAASPSSQEGWAALFSRLHVFNDAAQQLQGSSGPEKLQSQAEQLLQVADALLAEARATTQAISNDQQSAASLIVGSKVRK